MATPSVLRFAWWGLTALFLTGSSPAWGYGWLSHWRIAYEQWNSLVTDMCPQGSRGAKLLSPGDINKSEILYAAALGAIYSDIGYAFTSARKMSDLFHYIETGASTTEVTKKICGKYKNKRVLAFLAGFRSHYWSDRIGHYYGTNPVVAKLTPKVRFQGLPRVVYEHDEKTHKEVEMGTFSVLDLQSGSARRMALVFVGLHPQEEDFHDLVMEVMKEAITEVYGAAAWRIVQGIKLGVFAYRVSRSVCEAAVAVYSEDKPDGLRELVSECKKTLMGNENANGMSLAEVKGMIQAGIGHSRGRDAQWIAKQYGDSLIEVGKRIQQQSSGLPNFNLDTNLPSVAAQYRHSDRVYQSLKSKRSEPCDHKEFKIVAQAGRGGKDAYTAAGACARQFAKGKHQNVSCTALLKDPLVQALGAGWLQDIFYTPMPKPGATCSANSIHILGNTFQLGQQCTQIRGGPWRRIDAMYACLAAHEILTGSSPQQAEQRVQPMYAEAINRLRLDPQEEADMDLSLGLYK